MRPPTAIAISIFALTYLGCAASRSTAADGLQQVDSAADGESRGALLYQDGLWWPRVKTPGDSAADRRRRHSADGELNSIELERPDEPRAKTWQRQHQHHHHHHTGNQHREHHNYKTTYACEGTQMELSCQDEQLIHVVRANYGRFSLSICNDLGFSNYSTDCASFRAFLFMQTRCNKLNNCSVTVSEELFGDPCPRTSKYLEVQYYCNDVNNSNNKPAAPLQPQINGQQQQSGRNNQQPTGAATANGQPPQQLSTQNHKSHAAAASNQQVGGQAESGGSLPTATPATTANVFLDNANQQQPVIPSTSSFCSQQASSRNLYWNATRAGQLAQQPCPDGATGNAQWLCEAAPRPRFVPAHSPDFGQCRSIWLTRLAQQLDQMLEAPQKQQSAELRRQSDENMLRVVLNELTLMARTKELFGEDLKRMDIMIGQMIAELKSLAVLYGGGQLQQATDWRPRGPTADLLALYEQLFVRQANVLSSLFELDQKNAWLELAASERRRLEHRFLAHLKEAGLMLAQSLPGEQLGESLQPVKFANVVAGLTALAANSVQRHAVAADGTTADFNLFNQQQQANYLAKFNTQNPFGPDEQSDAPTRSAEFRLSASLADELAANGVAKFLIIDIKKPDYSLMMRLQSEQQLSSSQFANDLTSGGGAATMFDSSSSSGSQQTAASLAADQRFGARIFGVFAIAQDSGVTVLDSQQEQTVSSAKQLELNSKLQDSLAQWPISVEFRVPSGGNSERQCHSLGQEQLAGSNRCQLSRANATHFVCACDRFGFVSLTSVARSLPAGMMQSDQWPASQLRPDQLDFGLPNQLAGERLEDNANYGANYIQPSTKSNSSPSVVTTIFIFIGLGLLVLSLGACGISLVMRVASADGSKFGKKQQGFLDALRSAPTTGPMVVVDHNLLGSDPLVSGAATTQSASIIGLSTAGQQQHHGGNSLITSCNDGIYKTHQQQQLYAANINSSNFYEDTRRFDLRTTLSSLITKPVNWLASAVGLRPNYNSHLYDNSKSSQMIHQNHSQSGRLMGSSLNTNHSAANTLTSSAYKCQNGYTTSLGMYNPNNQPHMLAHQHQQHRTMIANSQHSVPFNSSSNSSYVSSSAYYEEIGPGNLTKMNPSSINHHSLQQQHPFNNWTNQRTLISGQPMQTTKHLIHQNDLSPLQSSSSSSSGGSQHSASTNLTTANSSTPRHYLFASPSAVNAYKQQFKNPRI